MIYLRSTTAPNGNVQLVASFAIGFDPDKAVIDVQNRVQAALPLLPEEVRRQGLTVRQLNATARSEEHTSELQSLMRISHAVFCLTKQNERKQHTTSQDQSLITTY